MNLLRAIAIASLIAGGFAGAVAVIWELSTPTAHALPLYAQCSAASTLCQLSGH